MRFRVAALLDERPGGRRGRRARIRLAALVGDELAAERRALRVLLDRRAELACDDAGHVVRREAAGGLLLLRSRIRAAERLLDRLLEVLHLLRLLLVLREL